MSETGVKRRLAAILAADVVGYSRLMGIEEAQTLERIQSLYRELVEPLVNRHGGRVVKLMGDGMLAEFPSAVEAVNCADQIQVSLASREAGRNPDDQLKLRIGINVGDIIVDGDDIFGDGVNVAARLEGLAATGGICLSESVRNAIGNKLQIDCEYLGEKAVKNISEPIRVYAVKRRPGPLHQQNTPPHSLPPAIAVLPFENLSRDREQEYFSDGITEDIITALSHFRSFPVIERNSTFTYKGQAVRAQQIAAELGARYVLEGSVRKASDRIRVTVQLIDADTGHHIWAGKYDRTLEDIFEVQDEITQQVVATIQPELAQVELRKLAVKRPENLSAWDLVLRGMALVNRHDPKDHKPSRDFFRAAIKLDPNYSDAWAGLAWSYLANVMLLGNEERPAMLEKGFQAAKEAIRLDDNSAFAHYVLGVAYTWNEQYQKGISEAETSLRLNPYSAQTHMGLGNRLDLVGRTAEGINKMERGLLLSPRDPFCSNVMAYLSRACLSIRQPDKALEWIEKAVNLRPENPDLLYRYAVCLASLDRVDEAKTSLAECELLQPGFISRRNQWQPYPDDERNANFFAGMIRHGLLE